MSTFHCRGAGRASRLRAFAFLPPFFLLAAVAQAQNLTPHVVSFIPSPDHATVDADGNAVVTGYDLELSEVGAEQPFAILNLGKPDPGSNGYITLDFAALLLSPPFDI